MPSALEADRPNFRPATCPNCGQPLKRVPILYGYPMPEAWEAERRGELVIGGCIVDDDEPEYACADCHEPVRATA